MTRDVFIVDVSLKSNRHEEGLLILRLNDRLNINAPLAFGRIDRMKAHILRLQLHGVGFYLT